MLIVSCSLNRLSTYVAEFTLVMIKDTFLPVYNVCLSSLLLIYNRQIGILFCLQSLAVWNVIIWEEETLHYRFLSKNIKESSLSAKNDSTKWLAYL